MASIAGERGETVGEMNLADWDVQRENTDWGHNRNKARQK